MLTRNPLRCNFGVYQLITRTDFLQSQESLFALEFTQTAENVEVVIGCACSSSGLIHSGTKFVSAHNWTGET